MLRRFLLIGLGLLLVTMAWTGTGSADDEFMFFDELEIGMDAIGKTIIRGNEIRSFQARIIALIDAPGELNDFIEIRVSGDVIRESGGVAAGMSGSPVYVDGKLIGALSRAISFDSHPSPFALVTPIGPMLELVSPARSQLAQSKEQEVSVISVDPAAIADTALEGYTELELVDRVPEEAVRNLNPNRYYASPIATPVLVSGMEGRAFEYFTKGFSDELANVVSNGLMMLPGRENFLQEMSIGLEDRYPVQMINTGLPARQTTPVGSRPGVDDLVAGGGIGVTLADGDVTLGSLGTVTYREDDIVLGFGHSFLFTGDVEYFLNRIYIYDTIANQQTPFKFGTITERMGTLYQDRFQGIAGAIGAKTRSVRMNMRITDESTGDVTHYSVDFIRDNSFLASLMFSSGLTLLDRTLNKVGKGTLDVEYTIRGAGLPRRLQREDIFVSFNDIAVPGPLQVAQVVFLLAQNEFQDPELDTIDVDLTYTPEVHSARLVGLTTDKDEYKPGETVNYEAEFMPYRGERFIVSGSLDVPEGLRSSRLTLYAFGGQRQTSTTSDGNGAPAFENLEEIIDLVEDLNRNDQLTVEFLSIPSGDIDDSDDITFTDQVNGWVISGENRITLEIDQSVEETTPEVEPEDEEDTETGTEEQSDDSTDTDPEDNDPGSEQSCTQLFFC
jgi:hypothetical protein